jgi:hypothetical protein
VRRALCQSATRPLWLNSHRPWAKGATTDSSCANAVVSDRTAPSRQVVAMVGASEANEASVQIGWARRYRTGWSRPSAYQPAPNPSTFTTPSSCVRADHDCTPSDRGGSRSSA